MPSATNYVCTLLPLQAEQLRLLLAERNYAFDMPQYTLWRAKKDKLNVVAYASGKLTVQGKGTDEFVQFLLEPEILGEARFGYETELAKIETPKMFEPHAGIDESGKGDYFGPLVIACLYTNENTARKLLDAGVADSKTIKSEKKMLELDALIRKECAGQFSLVTIGPEAYNRLYASFGNLNRLLAWGHAKSLEGLLELVPDCPRAISDQFAKTERTVQAALMERGRRISLEQHPRAEADVAVAGASILARAQFVRGIGKLGRELGEELPKGGGDGVKRLATKLAAKGGRELLAKVAKLHFCITEEALRS